MCSAFCRRKAAGKTALNNRANEASVIYTGAYKFQCLIIVADGQSFVNRYCGTFCILFLFCAQYVV